jgi:hypothetical protein
MTTAFQPPPTWALPIVIDGRTGLGEFNAIWLKWFVDLSGVLSSLGAGAGAPLHNQLSGLQGGSADEYYHLSAGDFALLTQYQAFPIGSIFTTISAANPLSLLGYGTWEAFGAGRVLVGVDTSDPDFDTVEETGGSKTVPCC